MLSCTSSPDNMMWLWERLIGFRGLLRAISASVFGERFSSSRSPVDNDFPLCCPPSLAPPTSLGPSPFPRMTVSFSSSVSPTVRLVSAVPGLSEKDLFGDGGSREFGTWRSVCMAVSVVCSELLGHWVRSSVEMATSTISLWKIGGKRTWERPLRELRGVLDDSEDTEELESEPCEDGGWPSLATVEDSPECLGLKSI